MFHNDTAVRLAAGGGGAEGEKGKINTTSTLFPGAAERRDLLWGNDDLCQGWKGRQGASGTKVCANND